MHRYHLPKSKNKRGQTKGGKGRSKILSADDSSSHGFESKEPSLLHSAVVRNSPEEVLSLLHKGADPNLRLQCSVTPLHCVFLSAIPQTEDYYNHLQIKSGIAARKAILIIKHLVGGGARLLPDSCGLTPISLALLNRCRLLSSQIIKNLDISVEVVIHYNYFSMPNSTSATVDLQKHISRLQRALSFHVKHGVKPLDSSLQFLNTQSSTELTDTMDVYASQFNSYLAVRRDKDKLLFNGVRVLLQQVSSRQTVHRPNNAPLPTFFSLFNSLIGWLNSHENLTSYNTTYCWQHIVEALNSEYVRANLGCILPVMIKFLQKFVLPLIESMDVHVHSADIVQTSFHSIVLMKVINDSGHSDLFPRKDQESVFSLFNTKHLNSLSIHSDLSLSYSNKYLFLDRKELLDFALHHLINLNDRIYLHDGTFLHTVAQFGNIELLRYFLNAGVSPFVKDRSGKTFITVLKHQGYRDISNAICQEFKLQRPYKLAVLTAYVYIRYRLPLKPLHRYPLLRNLVVNLCRRHECEQMCYHCYKEYFS